LHISNYIAIIAILALKSLLISYIVGSAFAILVAAFVADYLLYILRNPLNPSLYSLLFKFIPYLLLSSLYFCSIL
jgi:hypothetical protein